MRLNTNFIVRPSNLVFVFSIASWTLALVLLGLSIHLALEGHQLKINNIVLLEEIDKLDKQWIEKHENNYQELSKDDFYKLKDRIAKINQITGMAGRDISYVLSHLEDLLPDQSYLLSLNYQTYNDHLSFVIESSDIELLTHFIENLEKDELFGDITFTHQNPVGNVYHETVRFEVHAASINNRSSI